MRCPFCQHEDTHVLETRESAEEATRRRRECLKCQKRFTTYERLELNPIVVVKKTGLRESFDKDKLRKGMLRACEKRPITFNQINKSIDEIEADLRSYEKAEVPSKKIGTLVMKKLRKLDKVAYIRFASVYREFEDLGSFEKELKKLLKK